MAGSNPTVKVVFAGDSASLEAAQKRVAAGASAVSHQLKDTAAQAKYMKTSLAGAGNAAALFGGSLGNTAVNAGYALVAVKDLGKGLGGLTAHYGALRLSVLGVTAALAVGAVAATQNKTGLANLGNDAARPLATQLTHVDDIVQKLPNHLGFLGSITDSVTNKFRSMAGQSLTTRGQLEAMAASADNAAAALGRMANAQRAAGTYGIADANPGGDAFVDQSALDMMELDPAKLKAQYFPTKSSGGGGGASAVKSQANAVAQAAKDAAQKLKQARASVASAMGGILSALAGHLEAGDPGASLLVGGNMLSASKGTGLLDKLRKQADDTKHLADDLKKLSHMGLSKGLLSDLVAGGLGSLGAADELLKGGKSSVSTANSLNASITSSGTQIAAGEVNRNLTTKDWGTLKVDVTGGEDALKKMFRKWLRTDGANSFGLAAA